MLYAFQGKLDCTHIFPVFNFVAGLQLTLVPKTVSLLCSSDIAVIEANAWGKTKHGSDFEMK